MDEIRWFNPSQPQTMQFAVGLSYFQAVISLLNLGVISFNSNIPSPILFVAIAALAAGAVGCASERKIGYALATGGASMLVLAHSITVLRTGFSLRIASLMFAGALLWLLLHEQTRAYQRVWFR